MELLEQGLWLSSDQSSVSPTVSGHSPRAAPGTPRDPPGLELPQLPTESQVLSELGESSYFGCKCCIFSGSAALPRHGNFRMFHHRAVERKTFSACSGTRIQVQGVSSMFWTEILSECRLPEPSSAQALDFFDLQSFSAQSSCEWSSTGRWFQM